MDKTFQKSLRSAKIKCSEDFYDADINPDAEPVPPEWKVYFDGNFWGHRGRDRAGTEIALGKQFDWADRRWVIPAAIVFGKNPQGKPKTAYSSLHFEPAEDDIEWYLTFKIKQFEDKSFVLL